MQEIPGRVRVPISMSEGWYDHHLGSGLETYRSLPARVRARSEFLLGPWNHWFESPLEDKRAEHCQNDDLLRAFAWFHKLLVEGESPAGRVSRYIIGADRWMDSPAGGEPATEAFTLYLSGQGAARALTPHAGQAASGENGYLYDPADPVWTHGGESMLESRAEIGSLRQPGPGYRRDVLSFVSGPLERALTVCGAMEARLFVRSDADDTAFAVKVMEVGEDGVAHNVRGGITTLAYRGGDGRRRGYRAGDTVEAAVGMWEIAWRFRRGSRIRIDIQSSDFPQYAIHTNTAGVWSEQTAVKTARQTVLCGGEHPSRIILPVLPEENG